MRIGINGSGLIATGSPVAQIVDHAAQAEADGFSSYWLAQLAVPDALTVIGAMGPRTSTIELGTAVVPTWPRHPLMLAAQALTVQELIGNRLALGIGLAHQPTVETTFKVPFARPAKHMEEYLDVLLPVLTDRAVRSEGEIWSAEVEAVTGLPGAEAPTVLLAAMGPRMLRLAGTRAAGTILWLSGPRAIATLPSYRGVMDAEGVSGPAEVSLVGSEDEVRAGLAAFADAGATDFAAVEITLSDEERVATRALLAELAAQG